MISNYAEALNDLRKVDTPEEIKQFVNDYLMPSSENAHYSNSCKAHEMRNILEVVIAYIAYNVPSYERTLSQINDLLASLKIGEIITETTMGIDEYSQKIYRDYCIISNETVHQYIDEYMTENSFDL